MRKSTAADASMDHCMDLNVDIYDSFYAIEAYISEHPDFPWDFQFLSRSQWVSIGFVVSNKGFDWDLSAAMKSKHLTVDKILEIRGSLVGFKRCLGRQDYGYSQNPCVTCEDFENNPDIPWDLASFFSNPNANVKFARKHIDEVLRLQSPLFNPAFASMAKNPSFSASEILGILPERSWIWTPPEILRCPTLTMDVLTALKDARAINQWTDYLAAGFRTARKQEVVSNLIPGEEFFERVLSGEFNLKPVVDWDKFIERPDVSIDTAERAMSEGLVSFAAFMRKIPRDPDFISARLEEFPGLKSVYISDLVGAVRIVNRREFVEKATTMRKTVVLPGGFTTYDVMNRVFRGPFSDKVRDWVRAQDMGEQTKRNFEDVIICTGVCRDLAKVVVKYLKSWRD